MTQATGFGDSVMVKVKRAIPTDEPLQTPETTAQEEQDVTEEDEADVQAC